MSDERLNGSVRRVLLTRASADNAAIADALAAHDIAAIELPTVSIQSRNVLDDAPDGAAPRSLEALLFGAAAVAFTSRNAVHALMQTGRIRAVLRAAQAGVVVAAVGDRTCRALESQGITVNVVASPADGTSLARQLARKLQTGQRVVCPRAAHARPELVDGLRAAALVAEPLVCYENVPPPRPSEEACRRALSADLVYFAAPSAADRLYAWLPQLRAIRWVAIGPTTAAAVARQHGHEPVAVAQTPGLSDVVAAIVRGARWSPDGSSK